MATARRSLMGHKNYRLLREYKGANITPDRMRQMGAHGVGIGRKVVKGKATDRLALLVYVERKQPDSRLAARRVPETVSFLSRKEKREVRLPTDVVETPQPDFEQDPETRIRPVPGGVSFGTQAATGTLGGWVWDTIDDTIVGLSNNHVLLNNVGADTLQQGVADGGSLPGDKIGDVKRTIARQAPPAINTVDCAITDVDSADDVSLEVLEVGPAVYATATPVIDMRVEKYGQTTRHTFGEITDVDYELSTTSGFDYDDCIRIVPVSPSSDWSDGGDSGSIVFASEPVSGDIKPAVGLHFSGGGTAGNACKIQNVFGRLDLTTICAGFFAAFIEALFETEEMEDELDPRTEARLRGVAAAAARRPGRLLPPPVTTRAQRQARSRRFHRGISRDVQARIEASSRGRALSGFVDEHRAELASLLIKDGDLRRATTVTLRPLVAGATTTTDVLERALMPEDLEGLQRLGKELSRRGSPKIRKSMRPLLAFGKRAEGRTPAEILKLKP